MENGLSSWYSEGRQRAERADADFLDVLLNFGPLTSDDDEEDQRNESRGKDVAGGRNLAARGEAEAPPRKVRAIDREEFRLDWDEGAGEEEEDCHFEAFEEASAGRRDDRRRRLIEALDRCEASREGKADSGPRYPWMIDRRDASGRRPESPGYDPTTLLVPDQALGKMSKFARQYWTIKSKRMDLVLFVRHGSFYNLFDLDADVGMSVGLNLSGKRTPNMWKCGCSKSNFDHWAARVLGLGLSVGRVEEVGKGSAPEKGKILRRELVEVITPGTATRDAFASKSSSAPLLCVVQSDCFDSFGVCVLDALTARVSYGQFMDDSRGTLLRSLICATNPSEILFEQNTLKRSTEMVLRTHRTVYASRENGSVALSVLPRDPRNLPRLLCSEANPPDQRKALSRQVGRQISRRYFGPSPPDHIAASSGCPLAMASLLLCVRYLEDLGLAHTLLPSCAFADLASAGSGPKDGMFLDERAIRHLDLLRGSADGQESVTGSLLHFLDRTASPCGERLLREWIQRPLRTAAEINERLDAMEFLARRPRAGAAFQSCLREVGSDFERLLPRCLRILTRASGRDGRGEARVTEPRPGCVAMAATAALVDAQDITQGALLPVASLLENLGLLIDAAFALVKEVRGADAVPSLVAWFERTAASAAAPLRGLLSLLPPESFSAPEDDFAPSPGICEAYDACHERVERLASALDQGALEEALGDRRSGAVAFLGAARDAFTRSYPTWMEVVHATATLDVLIGFGKVVSPGSSLCPRGFCRPEFLPFGGGEGGEGELVIEGGWHPLLTHATSPAKIVPNDIALGREGSPIMVLTGPNMGGKSTLLRLSAICVIMSQMGCWVPARRARHTLFDRIFTRVGAEDRLVEGMSTFLVELQDTSVMLNAATARSLVILDELGRGTSTWDGTAIAKAVLSFLGKRIRCLTLFATHYAALCADPELTVCHMRLHAGEEGEAVPAYKLGAGIAPRGSCGIALAMRAGLPKKVTDRADEISQDNAKSCC